MFSDDDDYDERPGSSASSSSELSSSCSESDIKDVCYILNTKGLSEGLFTYSSFKKPSLFRIIAFAERNPSSTFAF